jgi:hypothetical protein
MNGAITQITNTIQELKEPQKRLLRFIAAKGKATEKELWFVHSNKPYVGKAAVLLHMMLGGLKNANLITVDNGTATWNMPNILGAIMDNVDAEKAEQYIKSLLL